MANSVSRPAGGPFDHSRSVLAFLPPRGNHSRAGPSSISIVKRQRARARERDYYYYDGPGGRAAGVCWVEGLAAETKQRRAG